MMMTLGSRREEEGRRTNVKSKDFFLGFKKLLMDVSTKILYEKPIECAELNDSPGVTWHSIREPLVSANPRNP